jgi:glutathione synthase/RimK-type ligase-like ATP-grasp enzyme
MALKTVALATHSGHPKLSADDQLLIPLLRDFDIEAQAVVWDNQETDWSEFNQVIIRSCWDYHLRLPEFLAWIAVLESRDVDLQNNGALVRWNADKRYLRRLEQSGITIPETHWLSEDEEASLSGVLAAHGWDCAVVKPTVSATAHKTKLVARDTDEILRGPAIVQKFMPEIQTQGESSFIFFDGEFSHAVCKLPAAGDFRVQTEFGGSVREFVPSRSVIDAATEVLRGLEYQPLYARVDGLEREGKFVLMELELIEPVLFFGLGGAASRFAQSIALSLDRPPVSLR